MKTRGRIFRTIVAACLPLLGAPSARPQEAINLAKLKNTVVDASSVNGGRALDNEFYGLQNLFDGGKNVINGINYTYWLSDSATRHWIKLRFEAPEEIRSIMLEFNAKTAMRGAVPIALAEADRSATHEMTSRRPEAASRGVGIPACRVGIPADMRRLPGAGSGVAPPYARKNAGAVA